MFHYNQTLRDINKRIRAQLPPSYQMQASQAIIQRILTLKIWRNSASIGFYHPVKGEVNLLALWNLALCENRICYLPKLRHDMSLIFLPFNQHSTFVKNKFGIDEPQVNEQMAINIEQIDLLFVPLLGFDSHGNRLGMGGGYYDRTLETKRPKKLVGIAYDFQRIPQLLPNSWDIAMDMIISPTHILERSIYPGDD